MSSEFVRLSVNVLADGSRRYFDSAGAEFVKLAASESVVRSLPLGKELEYVFICLFLVIVAGFMSGLNVSLLSISPTKIDLMELSSNAYDKVMVERIRPLLRDEHLLLVTLLVANAAAMEALPLFLDQLVASWMAVAISVTFVLIFGEIIPQAVFNKDPIRTGYRLAFLVRGLQVLLFPICYPLAWVLDRLIKHEHGAVFSKEEIGNLFRLIQSKNESQYAAARSQFDADEFKFLKGALALKTRPVTDEMVEWTQVDCLPADLRLDIEGLRRVWQTGFSRIPVFRGNANNVIGILLAKDLILVDPSPTLRLEQFVRKKPVVMPPGTNMIAAINVFQETRTHFALITEQWQTVERCLKNGEDIPEHVTFEGSITLEDIMEELICEEIEDEFDEDEKDGDDKGDALFKQLTADRSPDIDFKEHVPLSVGKRMKAKFRRDKRVQRNWQRSGCRKRVREFPEIRGVASVPPQALATSYEAMDSSPPLALFSQRPQSDGMLLDVKTDDTFALSDRSAFKSEGFVIEHRDSTRGSEAVTSPLLRH